MLSGPGETKFKEDKDVFTPDVDLTQVNAPQAEYKILFLKKQVNTI